MSKNMIATAKAFNIKNVEVQICRHNQSTKAIAEKFGKTREEVIRLIEWAYKNNPGRIRDLKGRLQTADEQEEKKQRALQRFVEEEQARQQEKKVGPAQPELSPIQRQEKVVKKAEEAFQRAKDAVSFAEEMLRKATEQQSSATKALQAAKKAKEDADDAVRVYMAEREAKAQRSKECKKNLEVEEKKLRELYTCPKLVHASAVQQEIEGNVFVSQWDYDHLPASLKGLVRPVSTEGMNLRAYPQDFFRWPERLGMESYRSAYEYALACMKMRAGADGDKLELVCNDETVMQLVKLQEVNE